MKKTYKSKKETTGAMDPRDVLLTLDGQSSVFDAFYIQNIKQTKRDMSVGSTMQFAASNKVRKRKYVKRIKEQSVLHQPRESTSSCTFLTPDKSFRVNKAPDLFDQLLNSSYNTPELLKPYTKHTLQRRNYAKNQHKNKNINYSSSDNTDSDKENMNGSIKADKTANSSDIKSHKLLIEEAKINLKSTDESICNLVNNLSIFSNLRNQTATPSNRNDCLSTFQKPIQNSPLCSTPFHKKYRGESIYRFSPITINLVDSPKDVTVINYEDKLSNSQKCDENEDLIDNKCETGATAEDIENKESHTPDKKSVVINRSQFVSLDNTAEIQSPILPNRTVSKRNQLKPTTHSLYSQTTEIKSFHGFGPREMYDDNQLSAICDKYKKLADILNVESSEADAPPNLKHINEIDSTKDNIQNTSLNSSSSSSFSQTESNYDTCNTSDDFDEIEKNYEPKVAVERLSDSVFNTYYEQMPNTSETPNSDNRSDVSDSYYCSDKNSESISDNSSDNPDISKNSIVEDSINDSDVNYDNESIFSNEIDNNDLKTEEEEFVSFVTTRRRNIPNDSVILYLDSSITSASGSEFDKTVLTPEVSRMTTRKSVRKTLGSTKSKSPNKFPTSEKRCSQNITRKSARMTLATKESQSPQNSPANEETCSRNITRKTARITFETKKSQSPQNSPTNEETCSRNITRKSPRITFETKKSQSPQNSPTNEETCSRNLTRKSPRITFETKKSQSPQNSPTNEETCSRNITRKSARITLATKKPHSPRNIPTIEESSSQNIIRKSSIIETKEKEIETYELNASIEKPRIVLQPGKRWERSLSIYRRMTTMADRFDKTLLDEEPLQYKGRKYRQSVITTMEMNDNGSLHNDSIKSRRSTFVSKPSRSTIKFVRESNSSRDSLCSTIVCEDLQGFLGEDCDDTILELSKLSIADSEHEVTLIEKFHDTSNRIATARDYVLRRCNQTDVLLFDECYPDPLLKNCRKIGEGVYGEVFLWRAGDGRARVLKVIPIAGSIKVNGEQQKGFHEIISEIVIAMELSALRTPIADVEKHLNEGESLETLDLHSVENATNVFNKVLSVRYVTGGYPSRLLDLWELYDESRGSENDNPAALPPEQEYIVLELANAGQDLEGYPFTNAEQAYALFKQLAFGLAVAEEAYQFEHRDLHWGNVLISPTDQKVSWFVIRGRAYSAPTGGVRPTVIDYSLSRASLGRGALYADLASDETLFDALGDYQFTVYRLMRDKLGNDWKNFEPYTNILWLHYTLDKMITALRYARTDTKIHKRYIAKLQAVKNRVLDYGSTVQLVLTDNEL